MLTRGIKLYVLYVDNFLVPFNFRRCYFTAESTNKKANFMRCLNSSYKLACLQCSFSDKELGEYIQFKKCEASRLPKKYAVQTVGQQADGSWVLASNAHLSQTGNVIDLENSQYVWLGDIFCGPGVALACDACTIELPLTTNPLCSLVEHLKAHMQHNFMPSMYDDYDINHPCSALPDTTQKVEVLSCPPCIWKLWNWRNYCVVMWSKEEV